MLHIFKWSSFVSFFFLLPSLYFNTIIKIFFIFYYYHSTAFGKCVRVNLLGCVCVCVLVLMKPAFLASVRYFMFPSSADPSWYLIQRHPLSSCQAHDSSERCRRTEEPAKDRKDGGKKTGSIHFSTLRPFWHLNFVNELSLQCV